MAKKRATSSNPRQLIAKAEMTERQRNTLQNMMNYRKSEAAYMKRAGLFTPRRQGNVDDAGNVYVVDQYKTVGGAAGRTLSSPEALREGAERRVGDSKKKKKR